MRKNNISVLEQQLKFVRDRYQAGEVTRTDVAQSEASLARSGPHRAIRGAVARLKTSVIDYRQIIDVEPKRLEPAVSVKKLLPKSLDAVQIAPAGRRGGVSHGRRGGTFGDGGAEHPLAESFRSPRRFCNNTIPSLVRRIYTCFPFRSSAQLNVPLYEGSSEYASIRQAKEQLGQVRLNSDLQ